MRSYIFIYIFIKLFNSINKLKSIELLSFIDTYNYYFF